VPGQTATALFGSLGGYFVLRYLLALLAGVPFYFLVRQRHGRQPAVAAFLLLMTSPWLARTLLWDYTDSTGVTFFFAAICLFMIEHRARRVLDVCAGVLTGLAIHSNVFVLVPIGLYFGVYTALWIWFRRGTRAIAGRLVSIAAAVAAVTAAGSFYYWWRVGRFDIFTITFQMVAELLAGGLADYRTPGVAWVGASWWALTPATVAMLATVTCAHRLRGNFDECVIWTGGVVTTVFFTAWQFLLNGTVLQLFYYFSYTLPAVFLMLSSILAALLDRLSDRTRQMSAAALVLAAIGPWVLHSFDVSALPGFAMHLVILVVASAMTVAATVIAWRNGVGPVLTMALIGLLFASSFSARPYPEVTSSRWNPDRVETDVYRTALLFMATIPTLKERPGEIRFWYDAADGGGALNSIQSTYLWGYSKLQGIGIGRDMPYLGPEEIERLRSPGLKWVGLLATNEARLMRGRTALLDNGVQHHTIERHMLNSGSVTIYIELLDLQKGP
jgi:hypothetical protein